MKTVAGAAHRARAASRADELESALDELAIAGGQRPAAGTIDALHDAARAAASGGSSACRSSTSSICATATACWRPEPIARAVMFCLMDVSASMDEDKKDLAKRFFTLLYLFLTRKYERGRARLHPPHRRRRGSRRGHVLPRHAQRRHGRATRRSSSLQQIRAERYAESDWNIYAAQASDGDAFGADPAQERALPARAPAAADALLHLPRAARTPNDAGHSIDAVGRVRASCASPSATSRCAARSERAARSIRCSAICSARRTAVSDANAGALDELRCRTAPTGTSSCSSATTRRSPKIAGGVRARHLPEPDRDHHLRADARRLRVQRPAARLSALVVRQGVHPQRAGVPQAACRASPTRS